jgi:hypothetical protein
LIEQVAGEVCDDASDWFAFTAPCDGFLGVETRVVGTLSLGGTAGTDVQTRLYASPPAAALRTTKPTTVALHPMHDEVVGGQTYYIEIEHADSDPVPYTLRVYMLPDGECGSASYICEGSSTYIAPTESSCIVNPTGGSCPGSRTYTQAVALPEVDDGQSGWADGWVIHVGADEVRNHHRPTTSEQALLLARCEQACLDEWQAVDSIDADCDHENAFSAITLRGTPSVPTQQLVPSGEHNGSGIFGSESLSCNVHETCCEGFASNLCPFRPKRVTPGPEPYTPSPRDQYVFDVSGSQATVEGGSAAIAFDGALGYSEPNAASGTRSVYLSNLSLEATNTPTVDLDCSDGTDPAPKITRLTVDLLQPAFGIRSASSGLVAFPTGSLLYRVFIELDEATTWTKDFVNPVPVGGSLSPSGLALAFEQGIRVPCGAGVADLAISVTLADAALDAHPPEIDLAIPSTMSCPGTLSLNASVTDPDSDLDTVRWMIAGYLMKSTISSVYVPFSSGSQVVSAIACDARGACVRADQTVTCT